MSLQTPKSVGFIREGCIVRQRQNSRRAMTLAVVDLLRVPDGGPTSGSMSGDATAPILDSTEVCVSAAMSALAPLSEDHRK